MKSAKMIFAAWLILIAAATAFAQNPPPVQSNVLTQQLTLMPQAPVQPVSTVQIQPSIGGSTVFYYWFVSHDASGNVGAPAGPFPSPNTSTPSSSYPAKINFTFPPGVVSVDILRLTTVGPPTGSCNCAVATGLTLASFSDTVSSTSAYTVTTSNSQIPCSITNVTSTCTISSPQAGIQITLSPSCANTANCFPINDNGVMATGCSWTSGNDTVNCPTGPFTSTIVDAGKDFGGYLTCQTNASLWRLDFPAGTTIVSVNSPTQAIVSNNASNTETGTGSTGCVIFGTPDDTNFAAAKAFWMASKQCLNIQMPSGIMVLKDPYNFFGSNSAYGEPTACLQAGATIGEGAGASYALDGTNPATSIIWLPPDFNTAHCNSQSEYGIACFWNANGLWRDFQITSGGINTFNFGTPSTLLFGGGQINGISNSNQFAFFDNFYCVNVAPSDGNLSGFTSGLWWMELRFVYEDGCGSIGANSGRGGAPIYALDSKFEDNNSFEVYASGGSFQSLGGNQFWDGRGQSNVGALQGTIALAPGDQIFANGGSNMYCWQGISGDTFTTNGGPGNANVFCNEPNGLKLQGGSAKLDGFYFPGPGAAINVLSSGVTIAASRSVLDNTGVSIQGNGNAPTFHDRGFNALGSISNDVVHDYDLVGQSGVVTAGDMATWAANGSLQDGGTLGKAIQSTSRTTLSADISLTSSTVTTVVSKTVTMPSSGCPCRVIAQYTIYLATNNWTGSSWVTDGTNYFAAGQTTGVGTNITAISASETSQTTYANSATPTFTLMFEDNGSGGTIKALPAQGNGSNTFLTLTVLTSN